MQEIAKYLVDHGNIKFGHFKLASGKESNYYVDVKSALLNPEFLRKVSKEAAKFVTGEKVAAVELGAVPFGVGVSLETGKELIIVRKEKKEYGLGKEYEGSIYNISRITFVEDVTTTGGTILRAINLMREKKVDVDRVIVVVDRNEGARENLKNIGVELYPLIEMDQLKKELGF
jgi:orotate phosphoribosyltransferase